MTVGALVYGVCVDSALAVDVYWSKKAADLLQYDTQSPYADLQVYTKENGVWVMKTYLHAPTLPFIEKPPAKTLPSIGFAACEFTPGAGLPEGFDYTILGALFAFAFSVVVGLWLFGKSAGSIVNIFKPK